MGIGTGSEGLLLGIKDLKPYLQWSNDQTLIGKTELSTDNWYHIAWQYNFSSEDRKQEKSAFLFVNGILDSQKKLTPFQNSTEPTYIGILDEEYGFNGLIDEVRVWKIAHSEDQIKADMHHCLVGNESELVGYWLVPQRILHGLPSRAW